MGVSAVGADRVRSTLCGRRGDRRHRQFSGRLYPITRTALPFGGRVLEWYRGTEFAVSGGEFTTTPPARCVIAIHTGKRVGADMG
ncbi:hypothetical protein B0H12DRAFT_1140180 [Mycena haematopus]|nr:hypothetical protein B0H12DRAFT_1140180 [Mycena haematopus]